MPSTQTDRLNGILTSTAVKPPCRVATTANITLSGLQTINGVALAEGDRVLVWQQTTQSENGIYIASTSDWTRAKDFDGNRDVVQGTRVLVAMPNSTHAEEYEVTTANPITIDTTSITFVLRYGANATYDRTAAEIAAGVTPTDYAYEPGWVNRYGNNAVPGTTNMAIAIQTADTVSSVVYFDAEEYFIGTTTISVTRGRRYLGRNYAAVSKITYSGNGSALRHNEGVVNTSYYGRVKLEHLWINGTGGANTGAGIELNTLGGSYFNVEYCQITGNFKYGIILDGAEITGVRKCIIENGTGISESANIWITNGNERTAAQNVGFSNVICISENQFNNAKYGVADDGGIQHQILDNNFNGNALPIRLAGVNTGRIAGNNLEGENGTGVGIADIICHDTSIVGGGATPNKGGCSGIKFDSMYLQTGTDGGAKMRFTASHASFHDAISVTNISFSGGIGRAAPATGAAIDVSWLRRSFCGYNYDPVIGGSGTGFHYAGLHFDPSSPTLLYPQGSFVDTPMDTYGRTDLKSYFLGGLQNALSTRATVDQSLTTTTTLTNVTNLSFAVKANEEWVADFELDMGDAFSTTGLKTAITAPTGATLNAITHVGVDSVNTASGNYIARTTTLGAAMDLTASNLTGSTKGLVRVSIWVLNGANAGTVQLQFAQSTSSGSALVIRKGSHMLTNRIA